MARPITLPGMLGGLAQRIGGVQKLADEIGVDPSTIRRWAHGKQNPSRAAKKNIERLQNQK
jgi:transcriptional regulator with XRE-family HTH domain